MTAQFRKLEALDFVEEIDDEPTQSENNMNVNCAENAESSSSSGEKSSPRGSKRAKLGESDQGMGDFEAATILAKFREVNKAAV